MTAGRKPGPIAAPFAHMPRHEAVVYICELSDGSVKVGYSFQPRQRFTMMARQLARSGRCILQSRLFPVSEQGAYALERRAISALGRVASVIQGHIEYFTGISFADACAAVAHELATPSKLYPVRTQ